MIKNDLVNKIFGRLTVLKIIEVEGKKGKFWECQCNCGNIKIARDHHLKSGNVKSCGCIKKEFIDNKKDLTGKIFERLTVLEKDYINLNYITYWKCQCLCGNIKSIGEPSLLNNRTKSCGCFKREISIKKIKKVNSEGKNKTSKSIYHPSITSARKVWHGHYKDGDLSFDDFYKISQLNCYYCNSSPSNKSKDNNKNSSFYVKNNSEFIYSGLDRIDSTKTHNTDNVLPCCLWCNRIKNNLSMGEYKNYIIKIFNTISIRSNVYNKKVKLNFSKPQLHSARRSGNYRRCKNELKFDDFLKISQLNCYYCHEEPKNMANWVKEDKRYRNEYPDYDMSQANFIYNGFDRVDVSKGHTIDNVVPCCKICNFGKNTLSQEEFTNQIIKIYNHFILPSSII